MQALPSADLEHILAHTAGLWEPLRNQNLFITGGTGFFGLWLLESFAFINERLDLGAHMTVLTLDTSAFSARAPRLAAHTCLSFVQDDVRRFTARRVRAQLPAGHNGHFSHVIHAATKASAKLNEEEPLLMIDTIVKGTRRALDFATATGARRFLFTSSGAVYGPQSSAVTHLSEEDRGGPDCTSPRSAYAEAKRLAEMLCACYAPLGVDAVIARGFAFAGPLLPLDAHFAIGNFIGNALAGERIEIQGDGTPRRSYLYAADLAIWLWHLLVRAEPNRPYNVGSEEALSIAELAALVAECSGGPVEIHIARKPDPRTVPSRYVPRTERAERELGLKTFIPLREALHRTFAWHRQEPSLVPCA